MSLAGAASTLVWVLLIIIVIIVIFLLLKFLFGVFFIGPMGFGAGIENLNFELNSLKTLS